MKAPSPKYSLSKIKKLLCDLDACFVTPNAHSGAIALGYMDKEAIVDVIEDLEPDDYYKSLGPVANFSIWQDVYKTNHNNNLIYLKLAMSANEKKVIVAQFKKK